MSVPSHAPLVVCAEDDEGHAILIEENLRAGGVLSSIEVLRDGQAAVDYFVGASPRFAPHDCVLLLDIRMPKLDGVEVLRRLRRTHGLRHPIIMFTTTDNPREVETCYGLGCSAYVQKPVDYDAFAETVRRLGWFIGLLTASTARSGAIVRDGSVATIGGQHGTLEPKGECPTPNA